MVRIALVTEVVASLNSRVWPFVKTSPERVSVATSTLATSRKLIDQSDGEMYNILDLIAYYVTVADVGIVIVICIGHC